MPRPVPRPLPGQIHAGVKSGLIEASRHQRSAVMARLNAAFDGVGASAMPLTAYGPDGMESVSASSDRFVLWGDAFGALARADGDGNAAGLRRSTTGFVGGGDLAVADHWRLGVLAGVSHSSYRTDTSAASAKSRDYHLGIYGGGRWDALSVRGGIGVGMHDIETRRRTGLASGSGTEARAGYEAYGLQGFGALGYRFDAGGFSAEPFVSLAHLRLWTGRYAERGGPQPLAGASTRSDTTFATLGLKAAMDIPVGEHSARLSAMVGWRAAFGNRQPHVTHGPPNSSAFAVSGTGVGKNAALLALGVDIGFADRARLRLSYDGVLAPRTHEHGLSARLGVRF